MTDFEDEEVCGFSYDHDLQLNYEDGEHRQYTCRRCGAELFEHLDEGDPT